jgi:hypothetical protein
MIWMALVLAFALQSSAKDSTSGLLGQWAPNLPIEADWK